MNQKILLTALLLLVISSCTIQPKVKIFNNAAEAIAISVAGDSYRIGSGKSRKIELYFVNQFEVQMGAVQYSYSVEYWPDEYAYFTGWGVFTDREMKAQFNADGTILLLTQNQNPPIAAVGGGQPRGFPLIPDAA